MPDLTHCWSTCWSSQPARSQIRTTRNLSQHELFRFRHVMKLRQLVASQIQPAIRLCNLRWPNIRWTCLLIRAVMFKIHPVMIKIQQTISRLQQARKYSCKELSRNQSSSPDFLRECLRLKLFYLLSHI